MSAIQFRTVVGEDQVIRPPEGVCLPEGEMDVIVTPRSSSPEPNDPLAPTRAWLLSLAKAAEETASNLPRDLAEHHDHYIHGTPLP